MIFTLLLLASSATFADTPPVQGDPGEQIASPLTEKEVGDAVTLAEKTLEAAIKNGTFNAKLTESNSDIERTYDILCEPKQRPLCVKSIQKALVREVGYQHLREMGQLLVPRLLKLTKKAVLKNLKKAKSVVEYYKRDYAKNVGDVTLFVLGTGPQGSITQMTNAGSGSQAEFIGWGVDQQKLDYDVRFAKAELKGIKDEVRDVFELKKLNIESIGAARLIKAVFSKLAKAENFLFVESGVYERGGVPFELMLAHELRHYLDYISFKEFNESRLEVASITAYSKKMQLAAKDFERVSKWPSYSKMKADIVQEMADKLGARDASAKEKIANNYESFVRKHYIDEYDFMISYYGSTAEQRAFREEIRFLRTHPTAAKMAFEDYFILSVNQNVWLTENDRKNFKLPRRVKGDNFTMQTIVPTVGVEALKEIYGMPVIDLKTWQKTPRSW